MVAARKAPALRPRRLAAADTRAISASACAMHSRMLPNIERMQAKSESPQLADQRIKQPCRQRAAAVRRTGCAE